MVHVWTRLTVPVKNVYLQWNRETGKGLYMQSLEIRCFKERIEKYVLLHSIHFYFEVIGTKCNLSVPTLMVPRAELQWVSLCVLEFSAPQIYMYIYMHI